MRNWMLSVFLLSLCTVNASPTSPTSPLEWAGSFEKSAGFGTTLRLELHANEEQQYADPTMRVVAIPNVSIDEGEASAVSAMRGVCASTSSDLQADATCYTLLMDMNSPTTTFTLTLSSAAASFAQYTEHMPVEKALAIYARDSQTLTATHAKQYDGAHDHAVALHDHDVAQHDHDLAQHDHDVARHSLVVAAVSIAFSMLTLGMVATLLVIRYCFPGRYRRFVLLDRTEATAGV